MTLDGWLEPRLAGAPPELAAAVRALLGEAAAATDGADPGGTPSDRLAAAALAGFEGVLEEATSDRPSRLAALRLLAADAALTYAFEAAADRGDDVVELADRLGPRGALGRRLAAADPGRS